ncbi:hypothetical protein THAOC_13892, partial [Thalassiosira oceanica]
STEPEQVEEPEEDDGVVMSVNNEEPEEDTSPRKKMMKGHLVATTLKEEIWWAMLTILSQFRLHRNAKPEQAADFFNEWSTYLQHVEQTGRKNQATDAGLLDKDGSTDATNQFGRDVDEDTRASFSEEQKKQLQKAARGS